MFELYETGEFYDEMLQGNEPKDHYRLFYSILKQFSEASLKEKYEMAQSSFLKQGKTFTVYGEDGGTDRTMPFDFVPIIIPTDKWERIEKGMKLRVEALNLFLEDVYHNQEIIKDRIIPKELVDQNCYYYKQVADINIP